MIQDNRTDILPLLSIITVVYNGENYIEKTLKSIANQNVSNYELIVIDGGSTDKTIQIVDKYRDYVTRLISEKDNGIYDAMNKGVGIATGEWVIFMNAGDQFVEGSLAIAKDYLSDHDIDVLYGDVLIDQGDRFVLDKARPLSTINYSLPFCHQSCFVRTRYLNQIKFSLKYLICADYDFFLKATYLDLRFKYIETPIAIFEYGGISSGISRRYLYEKLTIIIKNHEGFGKKLINTYRFLKMLIPINRNNLVGFFLRIKK